MQTEKYCADGGKQASISVPEIAVEYMNNALNHLVMTLRVALVVKLASRDHDLINKSKQGCMAGH